MGKLKLNGPGYDVEPNYDVEKLQGLNAGYLNYDNAGSGKKWSGGYGAHVVAGERYEIIEETKPEQPIFFELHDLYPEIGSTELSIDLNICLAGNCKTCTLRANDDRKWHSHNGIHENAKLNDCSKLHY